MLNVTSALKFLLTSIYILKCSALFWCIFKYLKQFLLGSYFIFSPFSFFVLSLQHIAPESTDVTAKHHLMKLRTMIVQLLEIISNLSFARWLERPWCLSAWKLLQPFTPKIMELWHMGCAYPSVKKKKLYYIFKLEGGKYAHQRYLHLWWMQKAHHDVFFGFSQAGDRIFIGHAPFPVPPVPFHT